MANEVRGALHWADAAVLAAVGAVVLAVSLPRLREFALRENESDARNLVQRLGELCAPPPTPATLHEALQRAPQLAARLEDVTWLADGVLRRHGYLFELDVDEIGASVTAWPWEHGRSGCQAFRWTPAGLEAHPNPGGGWSGLLARPEREGGTTPALDRAQWRSVAK